MKMDSEPALVTSPEDSASGVFGKGGLDLELRATLQLAMLPGLGPRTLASLLDRFGHCGAVLAASRDELVTVNGVGPKLVHAIATASDHVDVDAIIQWCGQQQVKIVCRDMEDYPRRLDDLYDAPPVLFTHGRVIIQDELAVAIVGTRHATPYGLKQAERFGYALGQAGVTVVSGLARGIDAAAHRGALRAGGRTLAVLGSGLGQIYPHEHVGLAEEIAANGAVLSEFSPLVKPRSGMFPQRNRLIAGLSLATLVVEAP
ncbi:MAG: DNA-processing protein DprA, partial [Pirellulales bacterium]|nr:DNA-processing protein DprA [Pirellulales bacterium]